MQTKEYIMEKNALGSQGTIFCGGRIFRKINVQNLRIFSNSISWNCVQYIFVSRVVAFCYALGILETGFK